MADKKAGKGAAEERLITVPLRKEWLKAPPNKRARRSVNTVRSHLSRHMKVPDKEVRVSAQLNDAIWKRGAAKPPSKVRVKASFDASSGLLHAMLPEEKPSAKEEPKKSAAPDEAKSPEAVSKAVQEAAGKAMSGEEVKKAVDRAVAEEKAKSPAGDKH